LFLLIPFLFSCCRISIIFDIKSKCVKLLDDGSGVDPLDKYNFGNAASYLFRPCSNEDGSPDEECDILYSTDVPYQLTPEERATIDAIKRTPVTAAAAGR
jgi:hypothetical protein